MWTVRCLDCAVRWCLHTGFQDHGIQNPESFLHVTVFGHVTLVPQVPALHPLSRGTVWPDAAPIKPRMTCTAVNVNTLSACQKSKSLWVVTCLTERQWKASQDSEKFEFAAKNHTDTFSFPQRLLRDGCSGMAAVLMTLPHSRLPMHGLC